MDPRRTPFVVRGARAAVGPLVALLSLGLGFAGGEAALRAFPQALLPEGVYGAGRFDPELGLSVAASTVHYQKVRYVRKQPNAHGFMDVDHAAEKPAGTLRVGFFGDSYVESNQVPLEQAFFRLLPPAVGGTPIEPFAFGISGWGTLQAFLAFEAQAPRYTLDRAYYVFVENDPADSSFAISGQRGVSPLPLAESSAEPPGYTIRWTRPPGDAPRWLAAAKTIQRESLLAQLLFQRWQLLRERGVRVRARAEDTQMRSNAHPSVDPTAIPTSWPAELREEAARVGRAVLADWKRSARERGVQLEVLYVPRGEAQLRGEIALEDTWLPWLRGVCAELGIPLLDPTDALRERVLGGVSVFDDHWSPAGHAAIAELLAEDLVERPAP